MVANVFAVLTCASVQCRRRRVALARRLRVGEQPAASGSQPPSSPLAALATALSVPTRSNAGANFDVSVRGYEAIR